MYSSLGSEFEVVGFTTYAHNFDLRDIPFAVHRSFSWGQLLRSRVARSVVTRMIGDYHDIQGLRRALTGFNVVHAAESFYYCTYQVARLKQQLGFRLAVTAWENIPFAANRPATRRIKQLVFQETDRFLAASERARTALLLEGVAEEKIRVQWPGVDTTHFRPMQKDESLLARWSCTPDDFIVLFVAHLYHQKGIFDLLYAFYLLRKRTGLSNLKLLIAGDGPERRAVLETIASLGLDTYVRLLGGHRYSDMPAIHNLADIFVLPSQPTPAWQEQFGYVLAESMACGKPVIGTLSGSIPEVIGEAGVLVQPADPTSLASALAGLLSSPTRRADLGAHARQRAEQLFSVLTVASQLERHYHELLCHEP
jgi:glycosyltransferase involved in cell wall biosynthesis